MTAKFNWKNHCTRSREAKAAFHSHAKKRLSALAEAMCFERSSFEIRSNLGGTAVSGEIILHHDDVYIQVSQSVMGPSKGIMIRTCEGRKDYTGGHNHFAPLDWLDKENLPKLVKLVSQIREQKIGFDADQVDDPSYHPVYSTPRFSR